MSLGNRSRPLEVAVVGGSIGGLTAAVALRNEGCRVTVYERSAEPMSSRGGGIVLQPNMIDWLAGSTRLDVERIAARTEYLRYLGPGDEVVLNQAQVWRTTSWSTIHGSLTREFGTRDLHIGRGVVGVESRADGALVRFLDGSVVEVDLVVFADGIQSVGRRRLARDAVPTYAGYVGWRGTVPEREVSERTRSLFGDAMSYAVVENSHIVVYPIPGRDGSIRPGERLVNYVWYRNAPEGPDLDEMLTDARGRPCAVTVPQGEVQDRYVAALREAALDLLPPAAAEVVATTADPYIQVMQDVSVEAMVFGRAVLIGDAAFALRPHAAAGTAKAVADAVALGEALAGTAMDVDRALLEWEPRQLELGRNLARRVREMGTRSQVSGTWVPGDPALEFGLYGPAGSTTG